MYVIDFKGKVSQTDNVIRLLLLFEIRVQTPAVYCLQPLYGNIIALGHSEQLQLHIRNRPANAQNLAPQTEYALKASVT